MKFILLLFVVVTVVRVSRNFKKEGSILKNEEISLSIPEKHSFSNSHSTSVANFNKKIGKLSVHGT
ncbi:hypothetical protein RB653_008084 [Dictyostelium firmibasis]|uniref:Uncharacterized protein n=1 Tax=Dictyostelium firmibasis TaxID=79012 RepID=A0AAN7TZ64_9MYCE